MNWYNSSTKGDKTKKKFLYAKNKSLRYMLKFSTLVPLGVYFLYLGFGAWMFVLLERPTEKDKCDFVNEFGQLYVNAGEEYVWSKYV